MKRATTRRKPWVKPATPQVLPLIDEGPPDNVEEEIFRRSPELRACLQAAILCAREAGLGWGGFASAAELQWVEASRAFAARLGARSHMAGGAPGRTDDIQLGNITHDRVIPERNASKPFTPTPKRGPSPTVKGFATSGPHGDDAGGFGGGR